MNPVKRIALTAARWARRKGSVAEALAPYAPVGFCGAAAKRGGEAIVEFGGKAVLGERAIQCDSIFRIASISKLFVAEAAMLLVKRGLIGLDDDISEILGYAVRNPKYPDRALTLRMLLTHTAALRDAGLYDAKLGMPDAPTLRALLADAASHHPFAPGAKYAYSNLGAGVAGMLVEKTANRPFDDFVRKEIFAPLSLDASYHPQKIAHRDALVNCYRLPQREPTYDAVSLAQTPLDETCDPERHYHIPAGKLLISAPELLKLMQRESPLLREMMTLQGKTGRGLGYAVTRGVFAPGKVMWGHSGSAYGAICQAWRDLDTGEAAVLLMNGVNPRSLFNVSLAGQTGMAALLDKIKA